MGCHGEGREPYPYAGLVNYTLLLWQLWWRDGVSLRTWLSEEEELDEQSGYAAGDDGGKDLDSIFQREGER